ncbi:MAG: crotonase/enoyl-CoA hydratase family protein [Rhodobacteraceae bacterium]|nr:crotonase/enoyl-CoA hydratase family protein [Paracoccaceae bacterium]
MSVSTTDHGRVRLIKTHRAAARGAVDPATARALYDVFLAFDADDRVDVAVFSGSEGAFCAGFDLKTAADGSASDWIDFVDIPPDWEDARATPLPGPMGPSRLLLRKPVIAAIEGHAVAGGMELAAWCDVRIMAETAVTGVFCRRWGVPLIDGGTVRLPAIMGQGRANDGILSGRPIAAEEARSLGFANQVVPEGQAEAAALDYAAALTAFPQGCMLADHAAARLTGPELARGLRREWRSAAMFAVEGQAGAARFAGGKGRGGDFTDI